MAVPWDYDERVRDSTGFPNPNSLYLLFFSLQRQKVWHFTQSDLV